jgi:excisionase family DNA binding protein
MTQPTITEALDMLRHGLELLAQTQAVGPDQSPLLDAAQLAEALSVPQTWIEQAAREGSIPVYRVGRYARFRRTEVEAVLRVGKPTSGAGA